TDLPITETTLDRRQIAIASPVTIDDKLRQVPGFALFRRSGSQTTNPTSQGVSLRGLGASGASRSLVLEDGVPENDPFGGWIYWARVPVASIESVDFVEGGASDLYGSNALGGVINLFTRPATQTAFFGETSYGSSTSPLGSAGATLQRGEWGASFFGEGFRTDGYIPVRESERGSVDSPANSRHRTADLLIQRAFADNSRFFVRGNLFGETRHNGTVLQLNNTTVRQITAGADWNTGVGAFTVRLYGGTQTLHQTFSAIAASRNFESLTTDQHVPVSQYGFSAQWSKLLTRRHIVTVGTDYRDITGDTNELGFFSGAPSAITIAGGRQQSLGIFAEDDFQITSRWVLAASIRGDLWHNIDAASRRFPFVGAPTLTHFANRDDAAVSPRLGLTRIVNDRLSLHASAYRSFRAPTLNELYRPFRVGNVLTQANSGLKAEYFTGGEFGGVGQITRAVQVRGTAFFGVLDNSVGNITLSTTPTLITRQRQNLGTVRVRGFELREESTLAHHFTLTAGYQFTDAVITHFLSDPTLVGLRTPQVPRHSFTVQAVYDNPSAITIAVQGRAVSNEFDDDRNTLSLDPYFNLSTSISHEICSGLTLFAAAENILNSRYAIARTPVTSVAAPVEVRLGIRFQASTHHDRKN
ncbi:MAG TPA: TonB-dependent receptor, partial [Terriglobales bacterium]|nr:TonB-dependent receptor [Terriglobales bacterium]